MRGIIIVYLFLILCNLFHEFPSKLGNLHSIPVSEEWYLIVVNRWNEIPEDYRVELTELSFNVNFGKCERHEKKSRKDIKQSNTT